MVQKKGDNQKVIEMIAIKEFIDQKSKEKFSGYYSDQKIQEVKKMLQKCNQPTSGEFTLTVGEINAYLG